jgi:hypothetical protein
VDQLKYGVLLAGLVGLASCFLPLGHGESVWALRSLSPSSTYLVMSGFAAAILVASVGVARPPLLRYQALVAVLGFALVLVKLRSVLDMLLTGPSIGGRLLAAAPMVGVVMCGLAMLKAAPAARR